MSSVRRTMPHTGECTRPGLCFGCAVALAVEWEHDHAGQSPWPKLASFETGFGMYREDADAPVQVIIKDSWSQNLEVLCELPLENVRKFCRTFGLDDCTGDLR